MAGRDYGGRFTKERSCCSVKSIEKIFIWISRFLNLLVNLMTFSLAFIIFILVLYGLGAFKGIIEFVKNLLVKTIQ